MKIWPFDPYAEASGGLYISNPDLDRALEPFRKIRAAVGNQMDIMVEFHSLWNLPTAKKIARALEEFEPFWYEDPIKADNIDALADYAASTFVPTTSAKRLPLAGPSARSCRPTRRASSCSISPGAAASPRRRRSRRMAEAHQFPVAPHDCTGPIVLVASTHLSLNAPNALLQESVRAYYTGWYTELVTDLPIFTTVTWTCPPNPASAPKLLPGLHDRKDAHVRASPL